MILQGHKTPIKVGDLYEHVKLGMGRIVWISPNKDTKFPIKMHFTDTQCFCFFNIYGLQFKEQQHALICFPKKPIPTRKKRKRAKVKSRVSRSSIEFAMTLELSEEEARALEALTKYGTESFLKMFYSKLGSHYLKPHEDGLKSLFQTIPKEIPPHLLKLDAARKVFD